MTVAGVHFDAGTIVRLLDGELAPDEAREVESHIAACEACERSRERLESLTRAFSGWAELAEPAPATNGTGHAPPRAGVGRLAGTILRSPAFRAAAVLVLVVGAAVALPPVLERIGDPDAPPAPESTPAAVEDPTGSVSVAFPPAGTRLTIRVERPQAGGVVRLTRAGGPEVEARVRGGDGAEELLVLPEGLAIRNPPGSSAGYRVAVPASLERIELYVAGRRVWSGTPDALPIDATLDAAAPPHRGTAAEEGEGVR